MRLTWNQIVQNSFVVTVDEKRYAAFVDNFKQSGLEIPKKFLGYSISDRYLLEHFKPLADLQFSPKRGLLERDLSLIHALCNNASHFAIVQHAEFLDLPFVAIFEDDAVPVEDCLKKLDYYLEEIPENTDVLRLGYLFLEDPRSKFYRSLSKEKLIVHPFPGSHAYIVFKKYYRRFLESNVDYPRCDHEKINPSSDKVVYALGESLFRQQNIEDAPVIHSYKLKNGMFKLPPVH